MTATIRTAGTAYIGAKTIRDTHNGRPNRDMCKTAIFGAKAADPIEVITTRAKTRGGTHKTTIGSTRTQTAILVEGQRTE